MVKLDEKSLHPQWAAEIKWSNHYFEKPGGLKLLIQFLRDNSLDSAMVTTIDKEGIKEIYDLRLTFVPAAVYAYTVGRDTLIQKAGRGNACFEI